MNRIKTIETKDIEKTVKNGGCGECQTSCQSACKTTSSARTAISNWQGAFTQREFTPDEENAA